MKELLITLLMIALLLAAGIFVSYLVGESSLPDWVKFWLLS